MSAGLSCTAPKLARGARLHRLLAVYLIVLLVFTFTPFTFSIDPALPLPALYDERFERFSSFSRASAWDVIINILLCVPFGFLLVALPSVSRCKLATKIIIAAVSACVVSFAIEFCQVFLPRTPSIVDLVVNTAGGVTVALIAVYHYTTRTRVAQGCVLRVQRSRSL